MSVQRSGRRASARADASPHQGAPRWHLHVFRRLGDDPFSSAVLYGCRCGEVRPGF